MTYSSQRMAGTVLLVGLAQFILLLQIAEDLYPNYSTSQNYISDLGATCKFPSGTCTIVQPSSFIFNSSIIILGSLVVISAYYLQRAFTKKVFSLFILLAGLGAIGVGLFPETTGISPSRRRVYNIYFHGTCCTNVVQNSTVSTELCFYHTGGTNPRYLAALHHRQ